MRQTTSRAIFRPSYLTSAFKPRFLQNNDALRSPELPPLSIHIHNNMIPVFISSEDCIQQRASASAQFMKSLAQLIPLLVYILPLGIDNFKKK